MKTHLKQLFATSEKVRDLSGWVERHDAAVTSPGEGFERALVEMFSVCLRYADTHEKEYETGIGDDGVLGPEWSRIGAALRGLLNGSLGRLDGGTLDSLIAETLKSQGFDPDRL